MKKTNSLILKILLAILIIIVTFAFILLNKNAIYDSININNIDMSGLDKVEALEYLKGKSRENLKHKSIKLKYNEEIYSLSYDNIGLDYDYSSAVDMAFEIGRKGRLYNKLKEILLCKFYGRNIDMKFIWDERKLEGELLLIEKNINTEAKSAKIQYINDELKIIEETVGKKLNKEALRNRIIVSINNKYSDVIMPIEENVPPVTSKMLSFIDGEISSFSTSFEGSSKGRINNIKLAASVLNGMLVMPEEEISFNNTTGSRSIENGYMESSIILAGDYITGVGGGVCQVSTTLYNALLLADVHILERHPHSIPASYVNKGRDAAVSYNYLDLKFKNDKETPLYIHTDVQGYKLAIKIFGNKHEEKNIEIKTSIVKKISPTREMKVDDNLKPGERIIVQKGRYGYKVKTYKIVYEKNKEKGKKLISFDYYKPRKEIIKLGPEKEDLLKEELENLNFTTQ